MNLPISDYSSAELLPKIVLYGCTSYVAECIPISKARVRFPEQTGRLSFEWIVASIQWKIADGLPALCFAQQGQ